MEKYARKIFQLNRLQHEKLGINMIVSLIYSKGGTSQSELTASLPCSHFGLAGEVHCMMKLKQQ